MKKQMKVDPRQEKYEKVLKLLRETDSEFSKGDSVAAVRYAMHGLSKEERKGILMELQDNPVQFLSLGKSAYLDFGFCAEAMDAAHKSYSKMLNKSAGSDEDKEDLLHGFEEMATKKVADVISEQLDIRQEKIHEEKFSRDLRISKNRDK